jgi:disulfide bond formation protein DsbB
MEVAHQVLSRPDGRLAAGLALAAILALAAALVLQYGFGYAPCELCLWQRWPYVVSIAAIVGGLLLGVPRAALAAAAAAFLAGAGLAGYHYGVEEGVFALPAGCLAGEPAQSLEELRRMLAAAPPRCDQPALLLGHSLAFWNLGLSLLLAAVALVGAWWAPRQGTAGALSS